VAILGLSEFKRALAKVAAEADETAKIAVSKTAAVAESGAKKNFQGSHPKGQPHVGGDKPNVVTGNARREIRTDPIRRYAVGDYGTVVAPRANYSRRLELGYPEGRNAYPFFMEPAKKACGEFRDIAAEQWRSFLQT
jgi:hypothetical protein